MDLRSLVFSVDFKNIDNSPIREADKAMDDIKKSMGGIVKESDKVSSSIKKSMNTSPVQKLNKATDKIKSAIKKTTDESTILGKTMDKLKQTKAIQFLSKGMDKVSGTVVKAKDKVMGLSSTFDKMKKSRIGEKIGGSINKIKPPILQVIGKAKSLGNAFKESMSKAKKYISEAGKQLKELQPKMEKLGKSMTRKVTAPIIGAGTAGTKMYMDVEQGIKKISTIADNKILPVNQIRKEVRDISDLSGIAQTEITEAAYSALSAGIDTKNVMAFVKSGIDLTRAGFTDIDTAIDATSTVLNAYGDKAFDVAKIHDIFVQTQDKGKITVDELGKNIGRVIPTASSLGVNMDQLGASYAIMTAKGQNANIATTNLSSMLDEMGKTGSASDKALRKMTGKSFPDLIKEGKSVGDVLGILDDGAKKSGKNLKDMFGSSTAGSAAVTLLSEGVDGFNQSLKDMNDSTGKTAKNAETMEDGWLKIQRATTQVKNSLVDFGAMIAPTVEVAATKVSDLVGKFNSLDDNTKKIIGKFALFAAAIGPVLWVLSKLIGIALGVGPAIAGIGSAIGFITTPAGVVIGVLIGLIATIAYLWKTNEDFRNKVIGVWESIQGALSVALEFIQNLWATHGESIKGTLSLVFETIQAIVLGAFDIIVGIVTVGVGIIQGLWSLFGNTIMMLASSAWSTIQGVIEGAMQVIQGIIDVVLGIITGNWDQTWSGLQSILEGATTIMSSLWSGLVDLLTAPVDAIVNIINDKFLSGSEKVLEIWGKVKEFLKNPIKGTVSLVSSGVDKVKGWFGGSHKTGLDRVPVDNYAANLHKDEMVLTKSASDQFRSMGGTKDGLPTTNNNDYSVSTVTTKNVTTEKKAPMQFNFNPSYNIEVKGNATDKEKEDLKKEMKRLAKESFEEFFYELNLKMS